LCASVTSVRLHPRFVDFFFSFSSAIPWESAGLTFHRDGKSTRIPRSSGIREERNFATRRARGEGEGGGEKGGRLHERTRGDAINWYCFIGYQRKPREGRQRICASPGESASVVSALFRLCVHICIHRCKHAAETRRRRSDGNRSSSAIGPRGYRERHVSYAGIVNWGSRWFGFSPGRSRI